MSARISLQATRLFTRQLPRPSQGRGRGQSRILLGSCLGLALGTGSILHSSPRIHFDKPSSSSLSSAFSTTSPSSRAFENAHRGEAGDERKGKGSGSGGGLDPDVMRQLSGGCVAGFLSGVVVALFSRTLVLLLGASVVLLQVAARYGIDIVNQLRLKQRLGKSRVLAAMEKDPMFKLSFGLFFALSAFAKF
ncbi:hypothetical protein F5B18DRAFT_652824 [Nemania serpens]|nr:hypothetical protein F5B18DRAFT_652824 [Nemania serpens]